MLRRALLASALLLPGGLPAVATPVDVELVLAVDVSQSMDAGEHRLQRAGYVEALLHPEVLRAVQTGIYGRVAITYVEWGGPGLQSVVLPWTLVEDAASLECGRRGAGRGALAHDPRHLDRRRARVRRRACSGRTASRASGG